MGQLVSEGCWKVVVTPGLAHVRKAILAQVGYNVVHGMVRLADRDRHLLVGWLNV